MTIDREPLNRLAGPHSRWPLQGAIAKILAVVAGTILLVSALAASLVLLVVGATAVAVFGAYFWWKTRAVRKELRARAQANSIIEGEVVRSNDGETVRRVSERRAPR